MECKSYKVVLDTNVLVSAALAIEAKRYRSASVELFERLLRGDFVGLSTQQGLYELAETLEDPILNLRVSFIFWFMYTVNQTVEMIPVRGLNMGCQDGDDDVFIEAAVNGRADYLVSHDAAFWHNNVLHELQKRDCHVVNTNQLLQVLRQTVRNEAPVEDYVSSDIGEQVQRFLSRYADFPDRSEELIVAEVRYRRAAFEYDYYKNTDVERSAYDKMLAARDALTRARNQK